MTDDNTTATPSQRRAMYVILGLPVVAVAVILGIGIYSQWGNITPRWKQNQESSEVAPDPATMSTNTPAEKPDSQ